MKAAVISLLSLSREAQLRVQVQRSDAGSPAPVVAWLQISPSLCPRELAPEMLLFAAVGLLLSAALLGASVDFRRDPQQDPVVLVGMVVWVLELEACKAQLYQLALVPRRRSLWNLYRASGGRHSGLQRK